MSKLEFIQKQFPDLLLSEAETLIPFVSGIKAMRFVNDRLGFKVPINGIDYDLQSLCESLSIEYPLK